MTLSLLGLSCEVSQNCVTTQQGKAKLVFYMCLSNVDKHTRSSDFEHINSEMLYY